MTPTDIKQLGADVKKLADHAKATGPKPPEGKLRSSINAVKHGLAGKNLLLPGEDAAEYEAAGYARSSSWPAIRGPGRQSSSR